MYRQDKDIDIKLIRYLNRTSNTEINIFVYYLMPKKIGIIKNDIFSKCLNSFERYSK